MHVLGREDSLLAKILGLTPTSGFANALEDYWPGASQFAHWHDSFVTAVVPDIPYVHGVVDTVVNFPSMPVVYAASVAANGVNTLGNGVGNFLHVINPFD